MPRKRKKSELTVFPMALAYCHVGRLLRPFVRRRPSFLAIFVVQVENMAGYFESALELLFKGKLDYGIRSVSDELIVKRVQKGGFSRDQVIGAAQSGLKHVVLIFADELDVPTEYRQAADVYEVIREFDASLIQGAVYHVCKCPIGAEEAVYLLQVTMDRATAAFRKGRPAVRAVQLLRRADLEKERVANTLTVTEEPPVRVEDLIGYGEAKRWGLQILRDLELFKAGKLAWRDVDPGVLLSGPTGTGKTRFAASLAHSSGVPLVHSSAAAWQAKGHLGDMLGAMHATFKMAADSSPCVLLIDELDSIGDRARLRGENQDYVRQVINALLECLDGALERQGVVVIGATNYPDLVDRALMRPGRIDTHIRMSLPDLEERLGILTQRLSIVLDGEVGVQLETLTENWTGAMLSKLARNARRVAREAGRDVTADDVLVAMPPTTLISHEGLTAAAVHESGHAVVGIALAQEIEVLRLADRYPDDVEAFSLGSVAFRRSRDTRKNRAYFLREIAVLMAGIAAEREVFGEHEAGGGGDERSDLVIATRIATMFESAFGMGSTLIAETGTDQDFAFLRVRDGGLWSRVDRLLLQQMDRAREIIRLNRDALDDLVKEVLERKKMSGSQIATFFAERDHVIRLPNEGTEFQPRAVRL